MSRVKFRGIISSFYTRVKDEAMQSGMILVIEKSKMR
jgi:hypothetical protein